MPGRWIRALACLLVLGACGACGRAPSGTGPQQVSLQQLSAKLGFELPAGARMLASREENGIDGAIMAKISMSPSEWPGFLTRAGLAETDFREEKRYLLGPEDAWWDPRRPASLPTAQRELAPGRILNVGVDRSVPDRVLLYVVWHET